MWKNPNLDLPSHVFLSSLATADLITGIIVQPLFVLHKTAWIYGNWSMDCIPRVITEIVAWISAAVTCATIGMISLDRMLALTLHMRYQLYVTRKRAIQVTIHIWISLTLLSFTRFFMTDIGPFIIIGIVGILAGILQVFISYAQIFKYMRHHQKKIAVQTIIPQPLGASSLDSEGNENIKAVKVKTLWKSAMNLAYVVVLYVIVYLPFVCTLIAFLVFGHTMVVDIFYDISRTFIFCGSVFNPLLYCWKIKDIKVEVLKTLARLKMDTKNNGIPSSSVSNIELDLHQNGTKTYQNSEIHRSEISVSTHL